MFNKIKKSLGFQGIASLKKCSFMLLIALFIGMFSACKTTPRTADGRPVTTSASDSNTFVNYRRAVMVFDGGVMLAQMHSSINKDVIDTLQSNFNKVEKAGAECEKVLPNYSTNLFGKYEKLKDGVQDAKMAMSFLH